MLLDLTTEINSKQEELKTEIERKNYIRAAHLAASLNLNNDEIESLRYQALCQMAETHRNAHGTKILTQKYGYSQKEVKQILKEHANKISADGSRKPLKVRYESFSGKYLTFEEWISHCIEKWDKMKTSMSGLTNSPTIGKRELKPTDIRSRVFTFHRIKVRR